jgi:hypothetical protein
MKADADVRRRDATSRASGLRVQLLHVAECPLVDGVRETVRQALARAGCDVRIEELEGDYPSPTLLVDGIDVVTGQPVAPHCACRLDSPTEEQVVVALCGARPRARGAAPGTGAGFGRVGERVRCTTR